MKFLSGNALCQRKDYTKDYQGCCFTIRLFGRDFSYKHACKLAPPIDFLGVAMFTETVEVAYEFRVWLCVELLGGGHIILNA